MEHYIKQEIFSTIATFNNLIEDKQLLEKIELFANQCTETIQKGNKVIFAGNGGSAADSQHLAAELVSRLNFNRPGLAAIAITTDTSAITAIGNDYGYENVFSRQLEAIGNPGDLLVAISTSGNSQNILNAVNVAKANNIFTVGMTGATGGRLMDLCDLVINVPSTSTQKIQECHISIGHIICAIIEANMFGEEFGVNISHAKAIA